MKKLKRITLFAFLATWMLSSFGCNRETIHPTTEASTSVVHTTVDHNVSAIDDHSLTDMAGSSVESSPAATLSDSETKPSSTEEISAITYVSTAEDTTPEKGCSSEETASVEDLSIAETAEDTRPAETIPEETPEASMTLPDPPAKSDPAYETATAYVPPTTVETIASTKPAPTTSSQKPQTPTTVQPETTPAPTVRPSEENTTTAEAPTTAAPPATQTPTTSAIPPTVAPCRVHSYDSEVTKQATCKSEGILTWICAVCGNTFTETIPKSTHRWDSGTTVKEATCGSDGQKRFKCMDCGETKTEVIPAQGEHHFTATKKVEQTKVGSLSDLGYTIYTCDKCGAIENRDYEGYLDCSWRYSAVNAYRTGAGRSVHTDEDTVVYFNQEGCVTLNPLTRAEGLESIAKLRAKQEAYDIFNEGRLDHFHDGLPCDYYYGSAYWGGLNCECCQAGGTEFEATLDATFRNEEGLSFDRQGHLQVVLNGGLNYIGIGVYCYQRYIIVVCEYSDIPN